MTDRQKKVLRDSFHMLAAAAQRGRRMVDDDATLADVELQAAAIAELAGALIRSVKNARGAEAVLARAQRPGLRLVR
jgi:hypothetical protein